MNGMELRNDVEAQKRLFRLSRLVSVEAARRNRKHFVFNKEVQKENVIKLNLFTSTTKRTEKIGVWRRFIAGSSRNRERLESVSSLNFTRKS